MLFGIGGPEQAAALVLQMFYLEYVAVADLVILYDCCTLMYRKNALYMSSWGHLDHGGQLM